MSWSYKNSHREFRDIYNELLNWGGEGIDDIEFRFDWDILDIFKPSSSGDVDDTIDIWCPETHVVLLKDSTSHDRFATTTCGEYLEKHYDSVWSQALLKLLGQFITSLKSLATIKEMASRHKPVPIPAAAIAAATFPVSVSAAASVFTAAHLLRIAGPLNGMTLAKIPRPASEDLKFDIPFTKGAFVDLSGSVAILHFRSFGDMCNTFDFIQAWDWLCKAVRRLADGVNISTASYEFTIKGAERSKRSSIRISSHLGAARLPEMKYGCWEALFKSCTLVVCDLESRLEFGKGLELSFDLMISLAAAEFGMIVAGGIVFAGYRTVLFPIEVNGNCAQFHLITTDNGQINPYTLQYGSRMLTENAIQFKKMRCFLGWCTNAQVNLGSKTLPTAITYSGGSDKGKSIQLDGFSAMAQAGASAPLSAILGLQSNFKYVSHRLQFTPSNSYFQLLQDTAKEVAMVYDAPQRRCWVVPKLSLLLHMSHAYASQCVGVPDDQVPSVMPHSNALDLVRILERSGENRILGVGGDAFCFRHLMLGLNTNLLKSTALIQDSSRKKIYGFEFMDIITQPGRGSCMKELKMEVAAKGWFDIANVVDAVVVCANLGDAITAADGNDTQNNQCNKIPCGSDYLATTIYCLKRLIERRGGVLGGTVMAQTLQISEDSYWDLAKDPFPECHHNFGSGACWQRADMFQHLISRWDWKKRRFFKRRPMPIMIPIPASGAVVFGAATS